MKFHGCFMQPSDILNRGTLIYSTNALYVSVHARRRGRGGKEEAVLRLPACIDAQAHAGALLELF